MTDVPRARRRGPGAQVLPHGEEPAGRARLAALLTAADAELHRRGVIRLDIPAGDAAGARRTTGVSIPMRALPALPRVPTLDELREDLPVHALETAGRLALALRRLAGRDVIDMESVNDVAGALLRIAMVRESHRDGDYAVDDFGFDREWTEAMLPLARIVYRRWWRVRTAGIEHVPRVGGALLVSNHAGVLPLDGAMIKTALFEEGVERHARALIAQWFFTLPVLSWFLRRSGQTLGHPDDTHRLLTAGELVLVFPEGIKGTGKLWKERYRLRRFGRGGFVQSAIEAGVSIVPVSVVGSEEIYPMLADLQPIARALGMPYFPVTPTWPMLGPLGLVPLPSSWRIRFHPPVRTDLLPPETGRDAGLVMQLADEVRDIIQQGLIADLMERRSVFG